MHRILHIPVIKFDMCATVSPTASLLHVLRIQRRIIGFENPKSRYRLEFGLAQKSKQICLKTSRSPSCQALQDNNENNTFYDCTLTAIFSR